MYGNRRLRERENKNIFNNLLIYSYMKPNETI